MNKPNEPIEFVRFFPCNNVPSGKRVAVFASYSTNSRIQDYVVYYLKELKKVVDAIVFVADNNVYETEIGKIQDLVVFAACKRHGCYDFGSYKIGFQWAQRNLNLQDFEELIFCNDSCYGPIFPLQEMFSIMQGSEADFWGVTRSYEVKDHLQSYFMLFRRNVYMSAPFQNFVNSFKQQRSLVEYVLNYELNFTQILCKAGFRASSYLETQALGDATHLMSQNPTKYPQSLYKIHVPFIKRKLYFVDFAQQMQESLMVVQEWIKGINETLFQTICADVNAYYTECRNEEPEWLALACEYSTSKDVLQTIASLAERNFVLLDEMRWERLAASSNYEETGAHYVDLERLKKVKAKRDKQLWFITVLSVVMAFALIVLATRFLYMVK